MAMFNKAEKSQSKLWLAVYGTSGSGKTMTSLRIAKGMGGKTAVIDTERGSASKYSDRFDFDVCQLEDKTIKGYSTAIQEAGKAGYEILVIDSLSHAWQELLEQIELLAKNKYNGNTFRAWAEGTPAQRDFIDVILSFPGHVICTMRSKSEWVVEQNEKGKAAPRKVGLAPEQGKGIEYEFDVLLVMDDNNTGKVEKDRSGKFQNMFINKPDEKFGKELADWLSTGKVIVPEAKAEGTPVSAENPAEKPPVEGKKADKTAEQGNGKAKETKALYDELYALLSAEEKEDFKLEFALKIKQDFYDKVPYALVTTKLATKKLQAIKTAAEKACEGF